ncbi:MAG: hypothetical protein KGJ14_07195 [Nitrospirota bacterium]|nr:hypothetical protein [Nitrospirota bacterium]
MRCPRCRQLMVVDHFTDMQLGGGPLWLRAWRCVSCGEVIEPGIARQRLAQRSRMTRLIERLTRRSPRISESVPLGV